jgi:hypothetical protein
VEPKTLGWDNSWKVFENGYENLRVVSTPLKCFLTGFWANGHLGYGRNGLVDHKMTLVFLCSRSKQLTRATTLPRYGTGLVQSLSALVRGASQLYKGL